MSPSGTDSGRHRDPAMLILYRHLRRNAHTFSGYEGDEEFSAVVRAAEAYEHYGCPLLSLVILKHWGYVMPVGGASKHTKKVRNILEVRRESIQSLPKSTSMSFRGGLRSPESSSNLNSGMLDFNDFGTSKSPESPKHEAVKKEQEQKSNGMSLMGGFTSGPPPGSGVDSGTLDFDSFGGGNKTSNGGGMSLMGGFKTTAPSTDINSGTFDFDSFESKRQNGNAEPKSTGMSLMGGFKSTAPSSNVSSGTIDFDNFGSTSNKQNDNAADLPKPTGMSLMGGFKTAAPSSDVSSGTFDFDSSGSTSTFSKQNGDATPKATGMSLMGGFKSAAPPINIDSGMLDFDSFGSMGNSSKPTSKSSGQARDIFAGFAPPADDGMGRVSKASGERGANSHFYDEDDVQGSEELLNDYITTLVVQLLTVSNLLAIMRLSSQLVVPVPVHLLKDEHFTFQHVANGICSPDCLIET